MFQLVNPKKNDKSKINMFPTTRCDCSTAPNINYASSSNGGLPGETKNPNDIAIR